MYNGNALDANTRGGGPMGPIVPVSGMLVNGNDIITRNVMDGLGYFSAKARRLLIAV